MARCFYCLGEHETSQCVSRATDRIVSRQQEAAKAASDAVERAGHQTLEQLREVGDDLLEGLYSVREAVQNLHSFLSWAHAEIVWRMEKQIELLTGISNMLKNPRATQGDELYKMGVDSFRRGRLPDALKLLGEARELNPGDYRVHVTLGHIHEQADCPSEALECFRAAVDYARSPDYKRDALLLVSRALRCLGQTEKAIDTARKALAIAPAYPPANYELASCMADTFKSPNNPR